MGVSSHHPGHVQFAMADGSLKVISQKVDSWYLHPKNGPIDSASKVPPIAAFGVYEKMIAIADGAED
jgi:hypothetical protein